MQIEVTCLGHVLFSLCVHLHSIEVEVRTVGAGGNAGRRATTHADTVCWPPNLHNEHAQLWVVLVQVLVVYLAQARTASKAQTAYQYPSWQQKAAKTQHDWENSRV